MIGLDRPAGTDRRKVGWEREAFLHNPQLDHLLSLDAEARALELAAAVDMEVSDYQALVRICAARRERGEGDVAKLAALYLRLDRAGRGARRARPKRCPSWRASG